MRNEIFVKQAGGLIRPVVPLLMPALETAQRFLRRPINPLVSQP